MHNDGTIESDHASVTGSDPEKNVHKPKPKVSTETFSTDVKKRRLLFKIDCWVMPTLSFLFFLSFLDKYVYHCC